MGGIGQHLGDYGATSFGVAGQLCLDDAQAAAGLDGDESRAAVAECYLAAEDSQSRTAGEGQDVGGVLDKRV